MKSFTVIALLLGLVALSSGLKVQNQFFSHTASELKAPLNDVLKDIEKEKQDDLSRIAHAKSELKLKEDEAKDAKAAFDAEALKAASELKKWQKTQSDLKIREDEFSKNDEVRSAEEDKISDIHKEIAKLAQTGPADGTIGIMPKSVLVAAKIALTDLVETSIHKNDAKSKAINLLQRSNTKISEITGAFKVLEGAIKSERKTDDDAVEAQKKIVKAANIVYEKAEALRVVKHNEYDEALRRIEIAKTVITHEEKEFKEAQAIRDADIKTIAEAMKLIDELIAVEAKHAKGPTTLLQVPAESKAAIGKVRAKIAAMVNDVNQEEKLQKMLLDMFKKKYMDAIKEYNIAASNYNTTYWEWTKMHKTAQEWFSKYDQAENALSTEMAVAEQERRTINLVREMLQKLQAAEADVLGSCPVDSIGAVCGGFGSCKTNKTDPYRTKYCACKSGSGRTGRTCSFCKFGWRMATGTLKGYCKQVYEPTITFLQTGAGQQYTVDDLNNAVETMMQTSRHSQTAAGVENLLAGLEKQLTLKENQLRETRDNAKRRHEDSETAAMKLHKKKLELKKIMQQKHIAMEKARKIYEKIHSMYWFEHPLRMQELKLLYKIDDIMIKLEGGTPPPRGEAVTQAALKASNTHTPTTTPSDAPTAKAV